nr:cobalt ECF transporter T component CbiQ [uncultured Oscillibacter sp.]
MSKVSNARAELREMDELSARTSPIHRLHPLAKLLVTLIYLFTVVSFPKYSFSALSVMLLYPVLIFQISGIPARLCFHKLRVMLVLVCAVGILNPFFDRVPMLTIGGLTVTGGVVSMATLMLKGVFALTASFLLIATTSIDRLCAALRQLRVPGILVTLLLLTYRYVSVMLRQVSVMTEAYALRAPGQRGIHISAWGSFLGQLLLRSIDRGSELYQSMELRGFRGEFHYARGGGYRAADLCYTLCWAAFFLAARLVDLPRLLGNLFV